MLFSAYDLYSDSSFPGVPVTPRNYVTTFYPKNKCLPFCDFKFHYKYISLDPHKKSLCVFQFCFLYMSSHCTVSYKGPLNTPNPESGGFSSPGCVVQGVCLMRILSHPNHWISGVGLCLWRRWCRLFLVSQGTVSLLHVVAQKFTPVPHSFDLTLFFFFYNNCQGNRQLSNRQSTKK